MTDINWQIHESNEVSGKGRSVRLIFTPDFLCKGAGKKLQFQEVWGTGGLR